MNQWNYYFSGILYGKIYEEESGLFVERLREETGVFEEKRPYREGIRLSVHIPFCF